eukprot:CCRYP_015193-RB/>CCRYP_015193-RB protein AED:0.03 eAED:0.03 QI:196/1/1/1/0/0/2/826/233
MKILPLLKVLVSTMPLASLRPCSSYSIITPRVHSRRKALESLASSATTVAITLTCSARIAHAKEAPATQSDVTILQEATEALSSLLGNWERATIDCTYADVPRELLEAKNKEKLLEKASEFALFDKSTSVVSCKRTNRIVRDYIGATGKGPLVGAEKRLLKKNVVEKVDPDSVDEYFSGEILCSLSAIICDVPDASLIDMLRIINRQRLSLFHKRCPGPLPCRILQVFLTLTL